MLARHDKGTANVAVFHEALTIRFAQNTRDFQRDIAGGFRNRDHHIDVQIFPLAGNLFTEFGAHIHTRAVNGNLIDKGVRTREIDVLEQTRVADRVVRALAGEELALLGDVHRFARRDIAQELKAQGIERHAFGSNHILGAAIANIAFAQHQRTDTVRVAEGDHTVTDNHRHAGVSATDLAVSRGNSGEDVIGFQRIMAEVVEFAGEDIQQDLGIRSGVDVAALLFEQFLTQFVRIGQVTVVGKRNAIRGVDVERLRLRRAGAASGWVTHVANPHVALHTLHMASFKDIADQPVCLA